MKLSVFLISCNFQTCLSLQFYFVEYVGAEGFDNESIANTTMYHLEETSENIEIIEPAAKTVDEDTERNGAVFIFHGAPNTGHT